MVHTVFSVACLCSTPNLIYSTVSSPEYTFCSVPSSVAITHAPPLLRWARVFTTDESAFSPESGIPKREELQPLYSQTPLIGRSFWPNVANFGNCLYLPYNLLGCTSRSSHFSKWVRTADENKRLPGMVIKALHGSDKLTCYVTSPI